MGTTTNSVREINAANEAQHGYVHARAVHAGLAMGLHLVETGAGEALLSMLEALLAAAGVDASELEELLEATRADVSHGAR